MLNSTHSNICMFNNTITIKSNVDTAINIFLELKSFQWHVEVLEWVVTFPFSYFDFWLLWRI